MRPAYWHSDVVAADWSDTHGAWLVAADVVDQDNAVRHDPAKLARTIIRAWARNCRVSRRIQAAGRPNIA
jgi:hypothetical protein